MSWISNLLVLFLFFVLLVMLLDLLRKRIRRHYSNAGGILYRKLCDEEVLEKENERLIGVIQSLVLSIESGNRLLEVRAAREARKKVPGIKTGEQVLGERRDEALSRELP